MVRAILDGTKTQTRRVVKGAPEDWSPVQPQVYAPTIVDRHGFEQPGPDAFGAGDEQGDHWIRCPYGQPGDRLWVRETWGYRCSSSTQQSGLFMNTVGYRADDARQTFGPMPMDGAGLPQQRDRAPDEALEKWEAYLNRYWRQWRPSIHMPRWASRITLEVTAVKVERLADISEADAKAEGAEPYRLPVHPDREHLRHVDGYHDLWESINGPGSWALNPWVWCVSFSRLGAA
jgi:hypothetical protein